MVGSVANWSARPIEWWGRLLLILSPPTMSRWKYGPRAARPSNTLSEAKRPDEMEISQLLNDCDQIL